MMSIMLKVTGSYLGSVALAFCQMELLSRPETEKNDRSDEPSRRDFPRAAWPNMLVLRKQNGVMYLEFAGYTGIYWDYM